MDILKASESNPFRKLLDAHSLSSGVELTFPDVLLLIDTLGNEIGAAEAEYFKWYQRIEEHERLTLESRGSNG